METTTYPSPSRQRRAPKIAIIGTGGRTGTMFAFELKNSAEVLGIGKEKDIKIIKEKKLFIQRKSKERKLFGEKVIQENEFEEKIQPDFILLTTKNPVGPAIKSYYQKFKKREKIPALLISQNGFSPLEEAKKTLKEIFNKDSEKIRIIRIALFNPVQKKEINGKVLINYSLPIKVALSKAAGPNGIEDLIEIFKGTNFEIEVFPEKEARDLEFSKLFLNLIGMAAASRDFFIKEGFLNSEILKEEIKALKEYIKVVKAAGGKFLNFSHYSLKLWTLLIEIIPINLLLFLKPFFIKIVSKGREEKSKDLEEIDFYNGAVVKLGKKLGIKTPVNERIYKRVIEKLER